MYLLYARPYTYGALLISLICWWFTYRYGPSAVGVLLFFKVATVLIGLWVLRRWQSKNSFFYLNLGYDENRLLAVISGVDLLLWLVVTTVILQSTS